MNCPFERTCQIFKQTLLALVLVLMSLGFMGTPAASSEAYALQPGDTVRATIVRIDNGSWSSIVDATGFVRFPYLGRHQAIGKTLDTLHSDMSLSVVGDALTLAGPDGDSVVVLDENDIFLDIERYRPITIGGAVNAPGTIEYEPGLTTRAAISRSGGLLVNQSGDTDVNRIISQTARLAELRTSEAWLLLELWVIQGQLTPDFNEDPPSAFADVLMARMDASVLQDARDRIAEARRQHDRAHVDALDRIALSEDRIRYLSQALTQFEVVSQAEEERLARLLTLQERGLTVANSVDNARAGALSASSRLLQTEADLSEARRDLRALKERQETLDAEIRQTLLSDQARVQRSLSEIGARIDGVRQELTSAVGLQIGLEDEATHALQLIMTRFQRVNGQASSQIISMDTLLSPGDVVEVAVAEREITPSQ